MSDFAGNNNTGLLPDYLYSRNVMYYYRPYKNIWATDDLHHYEYYDEIAGLYTMDVSELVEDSVWVDDVRIRGLCDVSRDGKMLLFRKEHYVVYTTARDGSNDIEVFRYSGYMDFPKLAPSMKKIAVSTNEQGLLLMNIDGSNVHRIATGRLVQWRSDNTLYLVTGGAEGITYITHYDTLGHALDTIIAPHLKRYALSPDNNWIAYNDILPDKSLLGIFNVFNRTSIIIEQNNWGSYAWLPNSEGLVYQKWHPCIFALENGRLWYSDLKGNLRQLTFHP
jgi:hypothetical protein